MHLDTDLHRGMEGTVDRRPQDDQFANRDGFTEVHVIKRRRHDELAAVARGRDRSGDIHKVHQLAAKQVPQAVGIVGKRQLRQF